jgi:hypothetical protein
MKRLLCGVLCVCFAGCGEPEPLCTLQSIADRHEIDVVDLYAAMRHADLGEDYAYRIVDWRKQSLLTQSQMDELVGVLDVPEVISERLTRRCDELERRCRKLTKGYDDIESRLAKLEAAVPRNERTPCAN